MSSPSPSPAIRSADPPVGLGAWMQRVVEECDRAAADFAPDPVHDLRVALRRCRSMADGLIAMDPAPSWKVMKKAGKKLFRSLGELRDVQVMEEWVHRLEHHDDPAGKALLDHLASREGELKLAAEQGVREFDRKQWLRWSRSLPRRAARFRPGSILFQHLALEKWMAAHELHRRALRNRSQVAFHSLRIGLKRFRYIVENFLPQQHVAWKDDLKELQDLLGEVHDLDVLWATALRLHAFPDADSRNRWHERLQKERQARIDRYHEKMVGKASLWPVWREALPQGPEIASAALSRLKLWASLLDPDFKHAEHLAQLALELHDGLPGKNGAGNSKGQDESSLLRMAALLHDVGRAKGDKNHHKRTFRLVTRMTPPLGWTERELRLAAAIARYHRGALPRAGQKTLAGLTPGERKMALRLAGILRLAEAFDRQHDRRILRVAVEEHNGYLRIDAEGYSPRDDMAEAIAGARHLLETVYRRPILVKPLAVAGLKLVS